jgi:hypothetical protein
MLRHEDAGWMMPNGQDEVLEVEVYNILKEKKKWSTSKTTCNDENCKKAKMNKIGLTLTKRK